METNTIHAKRHATFGILAIAFMVLLAGCDNGHKEKDQEIGEYVYLDRFNCIHINQKCVNLFLSGEDGEPRYMVNRIEVENLHDIGQTCSSCVSDKAYKELESRIKYPAGKNLDLE